MRRKIQLEFILFIVSAAFSVDHRYCELESCPNRTHTLCKYPHFPTSESCGIPVRFGLRGGEIQALLHFYNNNTPSFRFFEQSSESDATANNSVFLDFSMQWDEELADIAQTWANQCVNGTDECRNVDRFNVRQHVAAISTPRRGPRPTIHTIITSWFSEDALTPLNNLDFQNVSWQQITNYTANYFERLLRRNANRMGCGAIRTIDAQFQNLYLVCNFGPV